MATPTGKKFVKADKVEVTVNLGKTKQLRKGDVELVILLPPEVAKNLYVRLHTRFGKKQKSPQK